MVDLNSLVTLKPNSSQMQEQAKVKALSSEKYGDDAEIDKLNSQIEDQQAEIKETMKQAQAAVTKGAKEKAELLHNLATMKRQAVEVLRMQVKELQEQKEPAAEKAAASDNRPRFDRYTPSAEGREKQADSSTYQMVSRSGSREIKFQKPSEEDGINQNIAAGRSARFDETA